MEMEMEKEKEQKQEQEQKRGGGGQSSFSLFNFKGGKMRELTEDEVKQTLNYVLRELRSCCPSVFQRVVNNELTLNKAIEKVFLSINPAEWEPGASVHGEGL
jgi:hypothetical protein